MLKTRQIKLNKNFILLASTFKKKAPVYFLRSDKWPVCRSVRPERSVAVESPNLHTARVSHDCRCLEIRSKRDNKITTRSR